MTEPSVGALPGGSLSVRRSSEMSTSLLWDIDRICDRFEWQWRAGQRPGFAPFLAEVSAEQQPQLFQELLKVDLWYRLSKGERPRRDEYQPFDACFGPIVAALFDRSAEADTLARSMPTDLVGTAPGANDAQPLTAGAAFGPFVLEQLLGEGAFGRVWLARRESAVATTQVALKIAARAACPPEMLRAEAAIWVRASGHPNVLPIVEADIYEDQVAIASEYAAEGSLEALLRRSPDPWDVPAALEMAVGILSGLEHLHARGILHRDLKPANILLQGGLPRLADFGLAVLLGETATGSAVAGTPWYMAPEAFAGRRSARADLWSVGVILYRLLTGALPFSQTDLASLRADVISAPPRPVPAALPAGVQALLLRALEKEQSRRFQSAAQFRAAIQDVRRALAAGPANRGGAADARYLTVAVTGSMGADRGRVADRLRTILPAFLGGLTTWYAGTFGTVDEAAIELLTSAGQQVILVGYEQDDLSAAVAAAVKRHDLPLVNPHDEEPPRLPDAPSQRDLYFASKADVVILAWDGQSQGTARLRDWLQARRRDYLLCHV